MNASQVLYAHDVLFVGDVPVEDVVSAALDLLGVPTPDSMRATCTAASG